MQQRNTCGPVPQRITANNIFNSATRPISTMDHARVRHDPIQWPNGARVAVTWTVIFEMVSAPQVTFYPDQPIPAGPYGGNDVKWTMYGGRRGVWRILDLLDLHQMKASFLVGGYAAERFPSAVQEIHRRGHEIAGYGYASNRHLEELTPSEEKLDILKTLDILEKLTGTRPVGWVSPDLRPGDHTLEVLAGAGIMWNGDFPNDDLPYKIQVNGKPLVIIPYTKESDDKEILLQNWQPPSVWADCFIDGLDTLYEEGETHPKMLNASMRAHSLCRSVGKLAIDRAMRYAKSVPKVWFTTRTEIAKWWLERQYS